MGKAPDRIYGPLLANLFQKMCVEILKECGASACRVSAEFIFANGKGDLKMQTFTTPDAKTERLLDPNAPMPRGSKLQQDVFAKLKSVLLSLKKLGGK